MDKEQLLEKMYYITWYLKAANNEIVNAKRSMSDAITLNNNCFENYKFSNLTSGINNQLNEIEYRIIPQIKNM